MAWVQFLNTTLVLEQRLNLYGGKGYRLDFASRRTAVDRAVGDCLQSRCTVG